MKKYFMKNTEDELQFGDQIELDFSEEKNGKKTHHHLDCKFIPELVDLLIENGVVTVKEVEGEEPDEEETSVEEVLQDLEETADDHEERLTELEGKVAQLYQMYKHLKSGK